MESSSLFRYVPEFAGEDKGRLVETKMKQKTKTYDFVAAAAHVPLSASPPSSFLIVLLWQLNKISPGRAPEVCGRGPAAVFLCPGA